MKRRSFLSTVSAGLFGLSASSCSQRQPVTGRKKLFSFIHCTDIHLQPELAGDKGFLTAIDAMNALKPDFVITGGDLVMDALGVDESRAVLLYDMYRDCCKNFDVPVYNVIGNHELFGIYVPDIVSPNHPEWGKEMFKKRIGDGRTYRSFDHKGVHFLLLDSIGIVDNPEGPGKGYTGMVGEEQMAWLRNDLAAKPPEIPVIAVSHIGLFTLYTQVSQGPAAPMKPRTVIEDGKELYDLLAGHNLIGFFQGHRHINELYQYLAAKFIGTGAICGSGWKGHSKGHPEGFNQVTVYEDEVEARYIAYGWDAAKYQDVGVQSLYWDYSVPTVDYWDLA